MAINKKNFFFQSERKFLSDPLLPLKNSHKNSSTDSDK